MQHRQFEMFDTSDVQEYLSERYDEYDEDNLVMTFGAPNEDPWEDIEEGKLTIEEVIERRDDYIEKVIEAMCADDKFERELSSAILNAKYASAYDMFCATVRDFEETLDLR